MKKKYQTRKCRSEHSPKEEGGGGGRWSILPPAHPPEESPLALKSKTCINHLHRDRWCHTHAHTHWAKHVNITFVKSQSRRRQNRVTTRLTDGTKLPYRFTMTQTHIHVSLCTHIRRYLNTLKDCHTTGLRINILYVGLACQADEQHKLT